MIIKGGEMVRKTCVAGYFYPKQKESLLEMIKGFVEPDMKKKKALGAISPHAGYQYSGIVAGAVYSSIIIPDKIVLLGPSHRTINSNFAIMREGEWETPFGNIPINTKLADQIISRTKLVSEDIDAHIMEHSLEVQLPFIHYFNPNCSIVPLITTYFASYNDLEELGKSISSSIEALNEDVLILASTDMSHQVSQETAKEKDFLAIDKISKLDPRGLYDVVKSQKISMCGFQATTAALVSAKELGAKEAELIKYQTSGDVTEDYNNVVGYAGMRII
jgi:AmmeMemoRadiSam system protein B